MNQTSLILVTSHNEGCFHPWH